MLHVTGSSRSGLLAARLPGHGRAEVIASPDGEVLWVPGALPGRAIAILAVAGSAAIGVVSSTSQFHVWPDSSAAAAKLTSLVNPRGEYLAEDFNQFTYYLRDDIPLARWWNTWSFTYTDPKTNHKLTNAAAYAAAIRDRYYS